MFMSNPSQGINIRNITVRITKSFYINCPCIFFNSCFYFIKIMYINKGSLNSKSRKRMCHQIITASVNCFLCNNMSAILS